MIHITHHMDESRGEEGETERDWRGRERETDKRGMEERFLGRGGWERASEQRKGEGWRWRDRGVITWLSPTV